MTALIILKMLLLPLVVFVDPSRGLAAVMDQRCHSLRRHAIRRQRLPVCRKE